MEAVRYERVDVIGRGATSVVYRAHDTLLDRSVALKELHLDDAHDIAIEEARAAARISHPNVVIIHDVFAEGGRPVIAMELLDGPTLREALDAGSLTDAAQTLDICTQIAQSIAAAHAAGVVHRDIKPDNVFLVRSRVVVTDFGMALASLRGGTPGYMSPEQWDDEEPSPAADVFGWACVTVECLLGVPPFGYADADVEARTRAGPPPLRLGWPELEHLLDSCLRPRTSDRPKDGTELVALLELVRWKRQEWGADSMAPNPTPDHAVAAQGLAVVVHDATGSWPIVVPSSGLVFGREADVVLNDQLVSRRHAAISQYGGMWVVDDLGSLNGTQVNGHVVDRMVLVPGDVIWLGSVMVQVQDEVLAHG